MKDLSVMHGYNCGYIEIRDTPYFIDFVKSGYKICNLAQDPPFWNEMEIKRGDSNVRHTVRDCIDTNKLHLIDFKNNTFTMEINDPSFLFLFLFLFIFAFYYKQRKNYQQNCHC